MNRVSGKNRIKLILILCMPFGALVSLCFTLNRQKIFTAFLTAAAAAVLFYPTFKPHEKTVVKADKWEYQPEAQTASSPISPTQVTTTLVTTPQKSKATKTTTHRKAKKTTTKKATTTTTAKKEIIYLNDDSTVYTNISGTYMHTTPECKNLHGTIIIMTFKQSCKLCIPYCPVCANTVLYVPPDESDNDDYEDWEIDIYEGRGDVYWE